MTNEEIRLRLKSLASILPEHARMCRETLKQDLIVTELELLNMSAVAIFTMLGEIAMRLAEQKQKSNAQMDF